MREQMPNNNNQHKPFSGWKDQLQQLINDNNNTRIDGRVASNDTREERAKYLFKFMHDLRDMGFKVEPANIREKHIRAICEKFEQDQLAASTIQTYISFLRAFCEYSSQKSHLELFKNSRLLLKCVIQIRTNQKLVVLNV